MPAALALHLLGVLGWLKKLAVALVDLARRYPWQALALVLLCACAWQTRQVHQWKETSHRWQSTAKAMQDASEANKAAAIAQNRAWEAKSAEQAKENEHVETNLRRDLGALAAANADRMRADKVCRSYTAPASEGPSAQVDNGPGPDAIVLGRADYDTLIENTVRLEAAHQWGQSLVDAGQAVAGE